MEGGEATDSILQTTGSYYHRQYGVLPWFLVAIGLIMIATQVVSVAFGAIYWSTLILMLFFGIWMLVMACGLYYIEVKDLGDSLSIRFGPLPYVLCGMESNVIKYSDISTAHETNDILYQLAFGLKYRCGTKVYGTSYLCCNGNGKEIKRVMIQLRYQPCCCYDNIVITTDDYKNLMALFSRKGVSIAVPQ